MDFDILDFLEDVTKEADAFEHHPARELSLEERLLYLNGLALVMNADGNIDDEEKEYLRILIKSFEMDEATLDGFVEFAQSPDKDTAQAFFRTFRRKPIAQLFLFDALTMTRRDGKVEGKKIAVVNKIANQLEILKGTQNDIFDLFCHIKNRNWQESALYFNSYLLNPEHFKHLLAYHEVDFDELINETTVIRQNRFAQALQEKMPAVKTGENIKPTLDHSIVIPFLQAELERGNATVVNGILTLNNDENKSVDLNDVGIGWDKESVSLYSKENVEINSPVIIGELAEQLSNDSSMVEAIELLYGQEVIRMTVEGENVKSVSHDVSIDEMKINVCLVNQDLWIFRSSAEQNQSDLKLHENNWTISGQFVVTDGIYFAGFPKYQRCTQVACTWDKILSEGLKIQ